MSKLPSSSRWRCDPLQVPIFGVTPRQDVWGILVRYVLNPAGCVLFGMTKNSQALLCHAYPPIGFQAEGVLEVPFSSGVDFVADPSRYPPIDPRSPIAGAIWFDE